MLAEFSETFASERQGKKVLRKSYNEVRNLSLSPNIRVDISV
jgi:hypothetical protein